MVPWGHGSQVVEGMADIVSIFSSHPDHILYTCILTHGILLMRRTTKGQSMHFQELWSLTLQATISKKHWGTALVLFYCSQLCPNWVIIHGKTWTSMSYSSSIQLEWRYVNGIINMPLFLKLAGRPRRLWGMLGILENHSLDLRSRILYNTTWTWSPTCTASIPLQKLVWTYAWPSYDTSCEMFYGHAVHSHGSSPVVFWTLSRKWTCYSHEILALFTLVFSILSNLSGCQVDLWICILGCCNWEQVRSPPCSARQLE